MKILSRRLLAMVLVVATIFCMIVPASAATGEDEVAPAASAYINGVWAQAIGSNGTVKVNFSISATGTMTSLGATKIQIWNSGGTVSKTFYPSTTGGMTGYNRSSYASAVTWYNATPGSKYYAVVYYSASNSSGYDTAVYTTTYTYA